MRKLTKKQKIIIGIGTIATVGIGVIVYFLSQKVKAEPPLPPVPSCTLKVNLHVYKMPQPVGAIIELRNKDEKKSYFQTVTDANVYYFKNIPLGKYYLALSNEKGIEGSYEYCVKRGLMYHTDWMKCYTSKYKRNITTTIPEFLIIDHEYVFDLWYTP